MRPMWFYWPCVVRRRRGLCSRRADRCRRAAAPASSGTSRTAPGMMSMSKWWTRNKMTFAWYVGVLIQVLCILAFNYVHWTWMPSETVERHRYRKLEVDAEIYLTFGEWRLGKRMTFLRTSCNADQYQHLMMFIHTLKHSTCQIYPQSAPTLGGTSSHRLWRLCSPQRYWRSPKCFYLSCE